MYNIASLPPQGTVLVLTYKRVKVIKALTDHLSGLCEPVGLYHRHKEN